MKILIPVSKHRPVSDTVLKSIEDQGLYPEIVDCTFDPDIPKRKRVILSKERCREVGLAHGDIYTVIHDSDIQGTKTDNFFCMVNFLETNKDFGATSAFRTGVLVNGGFVYNAEIDNHICSGIIMFSKKGLESVNFNDGIGLRPTCYEIGNSLAKKQLKYGYVDTITRQKLV